jgi:hypothetical protein
MRIEINDDALKGFNSHSKKELSKAIKSFTDDLIKESNRIESSQKHTSSDPQITSSMVNDATIFIRRGLARPKIRIGTIVLRVFAAVLPLSAGILYDPNKLQNSNYMLFFILIVAAAIVVVTVSTIRE